LATAVRLGASAEQGQETAKETIQSIGRTLLVRPLPLVQCDAMQQAPHNMHHPCYACAWPLPRITCAGDGRACDRAWQNVHGGRWAVQTSKHYCGAILNYKRDHTPFWNFLRLLPLIDKARAMPLCCVLSATWHAVML
jgi:hypothetical protein